MKTIQRRIEQLKVEKSGVAILLEEKRNGLIEAKKNAANVDAAMEFFQAVASMIQAKIHQQISDVVSKCLESVFDEPYEFHIRFSVKRNQTEAELIFIRDGVEFDPISSCGGGVVDVAAFAMRIAALCLTSPSLRRLVILDEPFRFVSEGHRPALVALLDDLAERLDFQIIMTTHIRELICGNILEIGE